MANDYVHWRNLTDTNHLRAEVFRPGEEKVLTIKEVKKEEVFNGNNKKELRPVVYFEEKEVLPMVLNVTNCKAIENLYATGNVNEWIGKKIQVFTTRTKVGKETVPCLRIRNFVPESNEPEYKCSVCGVKINKETYDKTLAKFGKAYCGKECYEKETKGEDLL